MTRTQRMRAWLVLPALGLAIVTLAVPARADGPTVTLGQNGASPSSLDVASGQQVTFVNGDSVAHRITHTSGAWTFTATVPAGKRVSTPVLAPTATSTYGYRDDYAVAGVFPTSDNGTIRVTVAPATKPTPAPVRTAAPSPAPRAPAKPPAASASPATSASPAAPGAGTALAPGLGAVTLPTAGPTPSAGLPAPDLAGPPPETALAQPAPQSTVGAVYADKGLTQGSPHRYGLPAVLGVLAVTGVASLLARLLLSEPAARRRRTRPGSAAD